MISEREIRKYFRKLHQEGGITKRSVKYYKDLSERICKYVIEKSIEEHYRINELRQIQGMPKLKRIDVSKHKYFSGIDINTIIDFLNGESGQGNNDTDLSKYAGVEIA